MSDYISLEELRAMTGEQLFHRWAEAKFPFDTAGCGNCVTQHKYFAGLCSHRDFSERASHLKVTDRYAGVTFGTGFLNPPANNLNMPRPDELRANLAEIYALRLYYRDLYPSTPEPPIAAEEPRVLAAK